MLSLYTQTKCVTYRYSLIKITWVCTFTTKQKLKLKYPVSLWNFMEYSLVNIMSKKCGYILYMLSDYEASSKYTTHVITKSVNGCVYKWMRIPGGGGMYCYVWLSGDAGMKCPLLSVITRSVKVTWTLDISVWFCLPCCHWILTFHLYIIFILPKLVWMWKHSCKKKSFDLQSYDVCNKSNNDTF